MNKNIKKFNLAFFTAILGLNSGLNCYTQEYLNHVTNRYVNSYPVDFTKKEIKKESEKTFLERLQEGTFWKSLIEEKQISNYEKIGLIYKISDKEALDPNEIIDSSFIDKLEILCADSPEDKSASLVNKLAIDKKDSENSCILTMAGHKNLAHQLSQPISDIDKLNQRKTIIKHFQDSNTQTLCRNSLKIASKNENDVLAVFKELEEGLAKSFTDGLYAGSFGPFDQNSAWLTATTAFSTFTLLSLAVFSGGLAIGCNSESARTYMANAYFRGDKNMGKYGAYIAAPFFGYSAISTVGVIKQQFLILKFLQKNLIAVSNYIESARNLTLIINQNPELANNLTHFDKLKDLFSGSKKYSYSMHKLISMLDSYTFKNSPSVFSIWGRILAANKLMIEVKSEFSHVISAMGEIDMYVGIAKLMADNKNKPNKFCFANFISNSNRPQIKAVEFWNPFIDSNLAVSNTIELGTANNNFLNIILTGPNTGGKSVLLKGLILNLLLAQTFGIAAAQELELTPFSNLNAYLNVTDNVNANTSLFKAEVLRAKELITNIKKLPANEFSFTIMDEVFSGTSPQEGEYAAYAFSKQLGACPNSITVIATHYHKMVNLEAETNGIFKNFLVEVFRESDGTIKRTFKLKPGINHINIAMDILKQEGVL